MFARPSLTTVLSGLFLAYMANNLWSIAKLYLPPDCPSDCLTSALFKKKQDGQPQPDQLRLIFLTSTKPQPKLENDFTFVDAIDIDNVIDSYDDVERDVKIKLPKSVSARNGTMYLAIFSVPILAKTKTNDMSKMWMAQIKHPDATYSLVTLTTHQVPEAETFNLLGGGEDEKKEDEANKAKKAAARASDVPVVHIKSKIFVSVMNEEVALPRREIPAEVYPLVRLQEPKKAHYLPLVYVDELSQRLSDLVIVNKTDVQAEVKLIYRPISWGKLRLFIAFSSSLHSMKGLGFTDKDTDEVKGIFADTNLALLLVTFVVSAVHLLFDFLAFKNDISFWSGRTNMTGLSTRTLIWRAFSQTIIFLYLMEESTSLLVLVPSGVSVVIEFWKVSKAFGFSLSRGGVYRKFRETDDTASEEKFTEQIDGEAMTYLSYVLCPLLAGGAVYSLLYTPHKSWYSWTIQTAVNAVYAFGFLFMLPQLFVNYRLKSVAHLPWRAFMYKAFNTFIDDLFAFIITMPTAHRVACFRDDVVFLVYLYQRYLYPVDKSRIDASGMIEETTAGEVNEQTVTKPKKE